MIRKYRIKTKTRRLRGNKTRRILQIHRLKRSMAERRRVGFVILQVK